MGWTCWFRVIKKNLPITPTSCLFNIAMERSTMLFWWVNLNYFDWAIFNSNLYVYQVGTPKLQRSGMTPWISVKWSLDPPKIIGVEWDRPTKNGLTLMINRFLGYRLVDSSENQWILGLKIIWSSLHLVWWTTIPLQYRPWPYHGPKLLYSKTGSLSCRDGGNWFDLGDIWSFTSLKHTWVCLKMLG